ncbi:M48 family metallopeptidase [Halobacillus halophilus]|uniref:M48 family metallopeptidase n=1 Tax=Halobacillus halophilus TaxID=1570 RepID=UPI001CD75155|nr:SprT family zinc-dependent metalloprotease [Halobacillus halophilus]MCA1011764.1 M48 family metallopeptidase [Halobacillus halophilus]
MPIVNYGTTDIEYLIYKQNRKDLKLSIDLVNGVEVYVPEHLTDEKTTELIRKKSPWIMAKLKDLKQVDTEYQKKEYVSGEKLPYLGRQYRLKVYREAVSQVEFRFFQGKFKAIVPSHWEESALQETIETKLIKWYRKHGYQKVLERAAYYQSLLGVAPRTLNLKSQQKRWGTCTPKGDIYLNWRIVMAPVQVIDYVIVHELVHLIVPEHNQEFWETVKAILPDYEKHKEWLRVHGLSLHSVG